MAEKENLYDAVLNRLLSRIEMASDRISTNFKAVKPFDKERVDPKEAMLDFDDMMQREPELRQNFGDDIVDAYLRAQGGK